MEKFISKAALKEALYNAGLEDEALHEDYSGRAMYGDQCFGITGNLNDVCKVLIMLVPALAERSTNKSDAWGDAIETMASLTKSIRTDAMGLDMIAYFPGWTLWE